MTERPAKHRPCGDSVATVEIEVRYAETDAQGVVHHANYLVWFELARTRLCSNSGTTYAQIEARGHQLTVSGANVRYRRAARYGDVVEVSAWIDRLGSRGMRFAYEVRRGGESGEHLVSGTTDHIWVDSTRGTACRMPEALRAPFEELAKPTPS